MDNALQNEIVAAFEKFADQHVQAELAELRAFKKAIQENPDVRALYFGHYHGEPSAIDLIGEALDIPLKALCEVLGVERYDGYESDGGLDEAIAYNVASILKAANVMSAWDGSISRHPEDRDEKLEAKYIASRNRATHLAQSDGFGDPSSSEA